MLIIHSPKTYIPERDYIYKVMFEEFLSLPYEVNYEDRQDIEIRLDGSDPAKLSIADVFLQTPENVWMKLESLPARPLQRCEHPRFGTLPILFGKSQADGSYLDKSGSDAYCGIDIFGSAFYMLTLYEECVSQERDHLERFSAKSSTAYQESFLHRPIINEYLEILWEYLSGLWPHLRRRTRESRFFVSHDVDWPYFAVGRTKIGILKEVAGDIVKRGNIRSAFRKAMTLLRKDKSDLTKDPYYTFRWIMEQSERAGIQSSFYFITQETECGLDGNYTMYDPYIQKLLLEIHGRGHEIGLHPSYHTYLHPERIKNQFDILLDVTKRNRIEQEKWGGRQHFLRWRAPDTWQYWEDAGLHYDSTLSYADCSGFRCGICYEYPVYNLKTRKQLKLRERPLIIMDQTVLQSLYMGLKGRKALSFTREMYDQCKKYDGDFTLLWHNYRFIYKEDRELYQGCIDFMKAN